LKCLVTSRRGLAAPRTPGFSKEKHLPLARAGWPQRRAPTGALVSGDVVGMGELGVCWLSHSLRLGSAGFPAVLVARAGNQVFFKSLSGELGRMDF